MPCWLTAFCENLNYEDLKRLEKAIKYYIACVICTSTFINVLLAMSKLQVSFICNSFCFIFVSLPVFAF